MWNGRNKRLTQIFLVSEPLFRNNVLPPVGVSYISVGKISVMEAALHAAEFHRLGLTSFDLNDSSKICHQPEFSTMAFKWDDLLVCIKTNTGQWMESSNFYEIMGFRLIILCCGISSRNHVLPVVILGWRTESCDCGGLPGRGERGFSVVNFTYESWWKIIWPKAQKRGCKFL